MDISKIVLAVDVILALAIAPDIGKTVIPLHTQIVVFLHCLPNRVHEVSEVKDVLGVNAQHPMRGVENDAISIARIGFPVDQFEPN